MRYSPDHKASARAKLLDTAGALAKEKGFGTTGVDALMAAAGVTSGAFYSHFKSKPDLLKAIVENELGRTQALFAHQTRESLQRAMAAYLSETHVETPAKGCMLPTLSAEVARADEETKALFETHLKALESTLTDALPTETAWAAISQAVGAVLIARALPKGDLRKTVLKASRNEIKRMLNQDAENSQS